MTAGIRLARALAIAGSLIAVPHAAFAGDEIKASAEVSPTAGYSSNPFAGVASTPGTTLGSAYVKVELRPEVRVLDSHSVLTVSGDFDLEHYFGNYSGTNSYRGALDYADKISARLSAHGHLEYNSTITGGFDPVIPVIDPTLPPPPSTTGTTLGLFGTRARQRAIKLVGDTDYKLSESSLLTVNGHYDQSRYSSLGPQSSFDSYGGGLGYSRTISSHLQFGAKSSAARSVYKGFFGSSEVYSLQATVDDQFNTRWRLTGSFGASYAKRRIGGNKFKPTGDLLLCRVGPRSQLCATASEAVQPTSFSGTVVTQTGGVTYSYQLSQRSDFSLSGRYTHNERPAVAIPANGVVGAQRDLTGTASYDRTLSQRLHFLASTQYRTISGRQVSQRSDYSGTVGFIIQLGDYQ